MLAMEARVRWFVPLVLLVLFGRSAASAQDCSYPTAPFAQTLHQPDGRAIELSFRGSARNHWYEDAAGYPVLHTEAGYVYARRGSDGRLEPSDASVGASDPEGLGLERGVVPVPRRPQPVRSSVLETKRTALEPGPRGPFLRGMATTKNLVLLLRFSDHGPLGQNRALASQADVSAIMNAPGGDPVLAPTGSVRDHYLEDSYGQFAIDSTVVGWIDLPHTEAYYANGSAGLTALTWDLIVDGLNGADPLVDFADFDGDGDGWIDAITFLHSGYGAEWGGTDQYGSDYLDRMWSHKWTIPTWTSAEGVKVADYNISPGLWGLSGAEPGHIGVVCHELGHFFGLPDLYDTDGTSEGIGNWCLMAAGSWGFDGSQQFPSHMSAWCKYRLGWSTPQWLLPGAHAALASEFDPSVYVLDSGYPQGEFLLIENREPVGFDAALPQGGLAVWHVDERKGSFTFNDPNNDEGFPGLPGWPGNGAHYRVAMLQADGAFDMEQANGRGDAGDVYRSGLATVLSSTTTPSTNAYQDGVVITNSNRLQSIGVAGASVPFVFVNGTAPTVTTTNLPTAGVGLPYAQALTRVGGTAPYAWSEFLDEPSYTLSDLGAQPFLLGGTPQGFHAGEQTWAIDLPFAFPYYETTYTRVYVNPNGCVDLAPLENEFNNTRGSLRLLPRIAGLWDDLRTDGGGGADIYLDTSLPGQARIRWQARTVDLSLPVNLAITLFSDGRIRFDYGAGNTSLTPTVGISRAHGGDVVLAPFHDGQATLTNASSLEFQRVGSALPPGLTLSSAGVLSGTPTTPGLYTFRVRVMDALRRYHQKLVSLEVTGPFAKRRL